jgi:hypothetical protein
MKTSIAITIVLGLGLFAPAAFGQGAQAVQVKNRAKEVVNQNNVRQGVPPPSQNTPPAAAPAGPAPSTTASPAVLKSQNIAKIKSDLAGFKTGSSATAEQKQQFIKDLAVSARSTKPSLPTVTKFVEALTAALSEAVLASDQLGRLAQNIEAALNSKPLPASQFDAIIADVQAILQVGGVKRSAAASLAADLKKVGAEVRR